MSDTIKPIEKVKIGDRAYSCDDESFIGKVLDKGTFPELLSKGYSSPFSIDDLRELDEEEEIKEWVAVTQNPWETLEGYENLIFNYDFDPCGVYCTF